MEFGLWKDTLGRCLYQLFILCLSLAVAISFYILDRKRSGFTNCYLESKGICDHVVSLIMKEN